jgi:hypothetical protein
VRGLREGLTEEERYAVADAVALWFKEHGVICGDYRKEMPPQGVPSVARPWKPKGEEA